MRETFEEQLGRLATQSWPKCNPVPNESKVVFTWIVRLRQPGFDPQRLEPLETELTRETRSQLAKESSTEAPMVAGVTLTMVDDLRLLVHVYIQSPEDPPNAWLLASASALRTLDAREEIDELQGLPKRCWLILRSSDPNEGLATR